MVGRGHEAVLEVVEVVGMRVPEVLAVVVPVDRHQADPRLDEPAGEQEALAVDVSAVAVAGLGVFAVEPEGAAGLGRGRGRRRRGPGSSPRPRPTGRGSAAAGPVSETHARREAKRSGETPTGRSRPGTEKPGAFGSPSTRNGSNALPSQPASCPGARPPGAAGWATVQGIVTAEGTAPGVGRHFATIAPRCGQSFGDGPSASDFSFGAVWPVRSQWAVERCAGSSWFSDRTTASRSVCRGEQGEVLADPEARAWPSRSA